MFLMSFILISSQHCGFIMLKQEQEIFLLILYITSPADIV